MPEPLSLGISPLDQKLATVQAGKFTVFYGSPERRTLSFLFSVRCQLPLERGGWGSPVIFIDGGNTFDPYSISFLARKHGLDAESTLKRIFVSRAFTAYQLASLIFQKLAQAVDQFKAQLVIISDITTLFLDRDVPKTEAEPIFNKLTRHLTQLARQRKLGVVATHMPRRSSRRSVFITEALHGRADILAKLELKHRSLRFVVEKHPQLKVEEVEFLLDSQENSVTLEDFMEV